MSLHTSQWFLLSLRASAKVLIIAHKALHDAPLLLISLHFSLLSSPNHCIPATLVSLLLLKCQTLDNSLWLRMHFLQISLHGFELLIKCYLLSESFLAP